MWNHHSTYHKEAATCSDPMGGYTTNKGWDSWEIGPDVLENKIKVNCPHNYFPSLSLLSSCIPSRNSTNASTLATPTYITPCDTGIADTGSIAIYFAKYYSVTDINHTAPSFVWVRPLVKSNAPQPADASGFQPLLKRLVMATSSQLTSHTNRNWQVL